ncbi:hypothetical protein V2J09_012152 [Rumex salicifolius]
MDKKKRSKKKNNKQKKPTEDAAVVSISEQTSSHQEASDAPDLVHPDQSNESQSLHENHSNGNFGAGSDGSTLVEAKENQDWIKEEVRLNVVIKELQIEMEYRIQKEAELEMKLIKLQEEKDVSHQKEINLGEKISQLILEKDTLHIEEKKLLENVELLEREKALWIQEEDSLKQKIAAINDENTRMRVQVTESEECRKQLLLEKQQLMEDLSSSQSRIEELERSSATANSSSDITNDASKIDDLNSEIDAACQLVEKLITENADLVEKMNELYMELGHWQVKDGDPAISVPVSQTINNYATAYPEPEFSNEIALLTANANSNSSDRVLMEEERLVTNHSNGDYSVVNQKFPETTMSGEIVQIPLDEYETRDLESQELMDEKTSDGVPLSDSPLIGAPFRLISFMAKFVSGADLVRDDPSSVQQL